MPDPNYGQITDENVERLRARVGIEVDPDNFGPAEDPESTEERTPSRAFNQVVTADAVRHFVHGYGDDNPLYCSPDYASRSQWGEIVAPPLFVWTMFTEPFSLPTDPRDLTLGGRDEPPRRVKPHLLEVMRGDPLRGVGSLQARLEYQFFQPLRVNDQLFTKKALLGVRERTSSWGGRALHVTWGLVSWNQRRELVHFQRGTWVRAERRSVSDSSERQPAADRYMDEQLAVIDAAYEAERRQGATPRCWEDVAVGDELQPRVKGPLRLTDMIVWHVGWGFGFPTRAHQLNYQTRMAKPGLFTPDARNVPDVVQRMHWDLDWARQVGVAERYDYGAMRETWLSQLLSDWAGDSSWLAGLHVEHRRFNMLGDTSWLRGRVASKSESGDRHEVELEVEIQNQRDMTTSHGTAVVILPSRDALAVTLPRPPANDPLSLLQHEIAVLASKEYEE